MVAGQSSGTECTAVYANSVVANGSRVNEETAKTEPTRIGLCADCRHMRRIESARRSTFYRCHRSVTDPSYPKYPRLPVLTCRGYEPGNAKADLLDPQLLG